MTKKFKKTGKFSLDSAIENSKFDFCKNLKWFLIVPLTIIFVGLILLCTLGFNLGIDFTGGSTMTIFIDANAEFSEQKLDIDADYGKIEQKINKVLAEYGLHLSTLQKTEIGDTEEANRLGIQGKSAVIVKYQNDNSKKSEEIEEINNQIKLSFLKEFGFVDSDVEFKDLGELDANQLVENGGVITSSASAELMMKSFIALLVAMVLILIYVGFRFELTSGLAAILALFHDILVTASVMLICRIQINVAFIAALITILGYSINNTIIIFDRMRDDIKLARNTNSRIDNKKVANKAIKDTMMRSILTMVTTFVMIFFITVIGVPDIREFAFPIMVGILAGFYSSVFLTPGLWAVAYRPRKRKNLTKQEKTPSEDAVEIENA